MEQEECSSPFVAQLLRPLDWIRGGAYGIALSIVTLTFEKDTLAVLPIFVTVLLFLFLSFDGFLRYRLRDVFFERHDGRYPAATLIVLLSLFGIEVGGLFFFAGWAAGFIASGCRTLGQGYALISVFCILAAAHNLVYLFVVEFRAKDDARFFWEKNARLRLASAVPDYFVTAFAVDARESQLMPDYLWIRQLEAPERWLQGKLTKIKPHAPSVIFINAIRIGVRAMVHMTMQLCVIQAIFLNALLGIFCWYASSGGGYCVTWLPEGGILVWRYMLAAFVCYFVSSLLEMHREGRLDPGTVVDPVQTTTTAASLAIAARKMASDSLKIVSGNVTTPDEIASSVAASTIGIGDAARRAVEAASKVTDPARRAADPDPAKTVVEVAKLIDEAAKDVADKTAKIVGAVAKIGDPSIAIADRQKTLSVPIGILSDCAKQALVAAESVVAAAKSVTDASTRSPCVGERLFQGVGNTAFVVGLTLLVSRIGGDRLIFFALGCQAAIMIFMLFGVAEIDAASKKEAS